MGDDDGGIDAAERRRFELLGRLMRRSNHQLANIFAAMVGTVHLVELDVPQANPARESLQDLRKQLGRGAELARWQQELTAMPVAGGVDVGDELDGLAVAARGLLGLEVEVKMPVRPWTLKLAAVHLRQATIALLLDRSHILDEGARVTLAPTLIDELQDAPSPSPAWLQVVATDEGEPLGEGALAPELAAWAGGRLDVERTAEGVRSTLWLPSARDDRSETG